MSIAAMKQALEALEETTALNENWVSIADQESLEHLHEHRVVIKMGNTTIAALRATIAEVEKAEPVAWAAQVGGFAVHIEWGKRPDDNIHNTPLYTHSAPVPAGWQQVVQVAEGVAARQIARGFLVPQDASDLLEAIRKAAAPKPGEK